MALFFKLIAIFLLLSSHTSAEDNKQKILVEVNFFNWKNSNSTETFENLEELKVFDPFIDLRKVEIKNFQSSLKENIDKNNTKFAKTTLVALHRLDLLDDFDKVIGIKDGKIFFNIKRNNLKKFHLNKIY